MVTEKPTHYSTASSAASKGPISGGATAAGSGARDENMRVLLFLITCVVVVLVVDNVAKRYSANRHDDTSSRWRYWHRVGVAWHIWFRVAWVAAVAWSPCTNVPPSQLHTFMRPGHEPHTHLCGMRTNTCNH